jgi:gluconate 2-dehydrogenase gamma chain
LPKEIRGFSYHPTCLAERVNLFSEELTRREFVAALGSIGAIWLAGSDQERQAARDHAHQQAGGPQGTFAVFSPEQAADVDAIASRIIPTDDTPGAHEAGVVYFIDKSLTTFAKDQQPMFLEGLKKLSTDVSAKFPDQTRFSALTPSQQDEVLKSIADTPFFGAARFATIAGMLALPEYGGNKDFIGWKLIGESTDLDIKPPFGWYDRPENRRALLGGDA